MTRDWRFAMVRRVLACMLAAKSVAGQTSTPSGTIRPIGAIVGVVTDSALRAIPAAEVAIMFSKVHVATDASGQFRILAVPDGNYLLSIRRVAMEPVAISVTVRQDTARLAVTLQPRAQTLDPVTTTAPAGSARMRDFTERMQKGVGEFFDQSMIEQRNAVAAVDIIRQAHAVRVTRRGNALSAMSARQTTACPMQVYVDGVPLVGAGTSTDTPFDLDQLPSPKEIMGIEIYAGDATTPIWLPKGPPSGRLGCGAILVWTRDGI